MSEITVEKRDHRGQFLFRYSGTVVERTPTSVCLVATFGRDDVDAGYVVFRKGDTMTEWFFSDRWFNIFRLQDVHDGKLKGWYCNITRPAVISETLVYADDLALDVFVSPQGAMMVLDEDEFAALELTTEDAAGARAAVESLRALVVARDGTFAEIEPGR
ncbi:MAG: DUF402 domain-containing protein [Chloroflexota bacterium]|nr:DUF402 domain-containing protein [Chloroflexota bacterium]